MIGKARTTARTGGLGRLLERTSGRLALLGALVFAFWFASAVVASAVGAFPGLGEALWSGVQHLLDPGSLGDDETASQRLIGVAQVLLGIVLLVGLVLTLLSEVVDRMLRRLGESDPPARSANHLLVIGAGEALLPLLTRLQEREPGAEAVVLVPPGEPAARREMQARLEASLPRLAVRGVGAEATSPAGLERGAAASARAIAVLSEPGAADDVADVRAIEIATALARASGPGAPPQVGVEMRRGRNVDAVWHRFPPQIDAVVHDRVLGAVLTIVIRNPTFAALLGAISAQRREGGVFAVPAAEHAGHRFGELIGRFAEAIPVGIAPAADAARAAYAPAPETTLDASDALILAAPSERAATRVRAGAPGPAPVAAPTETVPPPRGLLVGWSEALASMLEALAGTPGQRPELSVLTRSDSRASHQGAAELAWREGDPGSPADVAAAIEALAPEVIFVAAGGSDGGRAADAAAMLTALHACHALGERRVPVLVEQRIRASSLAGSDERIHVVSASELTGESIVLAALDPLALAVQEALVAHRLERLRVAAGAGDATFAGVYGSLLAQGAVPIALAREGRALDATPDTPLRPGDELLVVRRAAQPR